MSVLFFMVGGLFCAVENFGWGTVSRVARKGWGTIRHANRKGWGTISRNACERWGTPCAVIPKKAGGLVRVMPWIDWGMPVPVSVWSASCADGRCGFLWLPVAVFSLWTVKCRHLSAEWLRTAQNGSESLRRYPVAWSASSAGSFCQHQQNGRRQGISIC